MSLGSSIRSAARATFSAYRRVPVRWRLGGGSAALTFVILAGFASVVGVLTERQISSEFSSNLGIATQYLQKAMFPWYDPRIKRVNCGSWINLTDFTRADNSQIRVFNQAGTVVCTQNRSFHKGISSNIVPAGTPRFAAPYRKGTFNEQGYRVEVLPIGWNGGSGWVLYALPLDGLDVTLNRLQIFLAVGVFSGTILALLAGLLVAQRAMRPVAELTDVSREIARTRDMSLSLPHFESNDEVSELANTLGAMLAGLNDARAESELALRRQREFVADASHELRTPLTSVLANLELLADELEGEQADSANAALRATRRMRRLVGDLLLLARADAERRRPLRPTDLGQRLTEAAAELGPVSENHELTISAGSAPLMGTADDLHRLVLNLLENAIHHTPPGTAIRARTSISDGQPTLVVEDDGPGIAPNLQARVFERFVRGGGDTSEVRRGTGLGLAIVQAVADAHGATVKLTSTPRIHGTRFEIRFPARDTTHTHAADTQVPPPLFGEPQTSTTTGSTIGRRRSRS